MLNPPQNKSSFNCCIIIPAFNESGIIYDTVKTLCKLNRYKIIVIDDGSDRLIHFNLQDYPNVFVLRHKVNLGQGAALQTGIEFSLLFSPDFVVTFDADGQHSADDIESLLEPLMKNEADVVLGSRFLKPGLHNASVGRKFIIQAGRWVNYLFTGLYLTDAHNGLRAMTGRAAARLTISENRMAHATEILLQIKQLKLRYKEVPVKINYTAYSKSKGQPGINSIRIFFDLVLHKMFE